MLSESSGPEYRLTVRCIPSNLCSQFQRASCLLKNFELCAGEQQAPVKENLEQGSSRLGRARLERLGSRPF